VHRGKDHIIIIGAGASGLMAAVTLLEENRAVTIVEARDRIGGRIHTCFGKFSLPVEAGAEFMHGQQPLTKKLAGDAGSDLVLLSGNRFRLSDGVLNRGDFFDEHWEDLTNELARLEQDTDLGSFLEKHFKDDKYKDLRKNVRAFVEGYDAADLHRVSAMALGEEWSESDDEHQYHLRGGYGKLMLHLEKKIRSLGGTISLSSPVSGIDWAAGNVKVHTDKQVLNGDKLIITVPLGVLQKGAITFNPALPAHQEAFNKMGFGGVIKFFLEFKTAFWQDRIARPFKDAAFIFSDAAVPTWWSQLPDRTPLLTGWLGGPGIRYINHEPEALYKNAIQSLQYIFQTGASAIQDQVCQWHVTDWSVDQFAYGAYAYPTVEGRKSNEFITQPVRETIYFAGEAFYNGPAMGTVEAALVSGKEVAGEVVQSFRR
jgi:monoamine oxidase